MILFLLSFVTLSLSILSVWIRRSYWIWGSLLALSLYFSIRSGVITLEGAGIFSGWIALWAIYVGLQPKRRSIQLCFLLLFILLSFGFKFYLFPGLHPIPITSQFRLGIETPLLGLLPLALSVPLINRSTNRKGWNQITIGLLIGILGIAVLSLIAVVSGAVHWEYKTPSYAAMRYASNLILTAIPEEAFYRGFVQKELCHHLGKRRGSQWIAVLLTTLIFTIAHIYWSPSLDILGFVFLAGMLYGAVYLLSNKIESAILTHFLLNFVHMTFFSYHAM